MWLLSKTSSLIHWFTGNCDICFKRRTNQSLEIRINQHIGTRTHTSDYTTTPSSYNSISAIGRHLLTRQTCACVYSLTMFTILVTSTNELQQSILEVLLIKKYKPELCIQNQSFTPLLFNNLLRRSEENIINRNNSASSR